MGSEMCIRDRAQTLRAEAHAYTSKVRAEAESAVSQVQLSARSQAETIRSQAASEVETVRSYASTTLRAMEAQMATKDSELEALRLEMEALRRGRMQEVVSQLRAPSMASSHHPEEWSIATPKQNRTHYTPSMGDLSGENALVPSTPSSTLRSWDPALLSVLWF